MKRILGELIFTVCFAAVMAIIYAVCLWILGRPIFES